MTSTTTATSSAERAQQRVLDAVDEVESIVDGHDLDAPAAGAGAARSSVRLTPSMTTLGSASRRATTMPPIVGRAPSRSAMPVGMSAAMVAWATSPIRVAASAGLRTGATVRHAGGSRCARRSGSPCAAGAHRGDHVAERDAARPELVRLGLHDQLLDASRRPTPPPPRRGSPPAPGAAAPPAAAPSAHAAVGATDRPARTGTPSRCSTPRGRPARGRSAAAADAALATRCDDLLPRRLEARRTSRRRRRRRPCRTSTSRGPPSRRGSPRARRSAPGSRGWRPRWPGAPSSRPRARSADPRDPGPRRATATGGPTRRPPPRRSPRR